MLGKIESERRGQQRMRGLDSITDSMDTNLSKLGEIVEAQRALHAAATEQQQQLAFFGLQFADGRA